ncbi:MAG TPA: PQQ-binding-like beta-propeller repeat protein [Chitinophagales bacterium]|nr:PQQ-binding-like beta-propeller repeat protein [Chitinophagales bacterium]
MKASALLLLIAVSVSSAYSQQAPVWKLSLPEAILWEKITPLGIVVAATPNGLYGIDPEKGAIAWKQINPVVANLPEDNYEVITNTPFVAIVGKGNLPQHVVLNSATGKIICNSKDAGISGVVSRYILYETGNILIYGVSGGFKPVVALFDISTGQIKWQKSDMFGKGFLAEKIQGKPLEDGKDAFITATTGGVYKVNTNTGEVIWKQPLPKVGMVSASETETKLLRSVRPDEFYFLNNTYAMSYKLSDGSQRWKQVAKQSGLVDRIIFDPEGLIIASAVDPKNNIVKPKISLFDYETGVQKWEKGAKLNGTVRAYSYSKKGLVIAMESEHGNYSINIVNLSTGEFILDKPLKVKGTLEEIRMTDKGVLYLTTNEINILSLTTGDPVFPKSIKASEDHSVLRAEKDNLIYAYSTSENALYKVNVDAGTMQSIATGIKFDANETPLSLETRDNGVLLSSNQNMTLFGFDGKQIYHSFYPAPGISNFAKAVYGISAVLHSYDAMRYGAASAAFSGAAVQETDPGYRAMYAGFGDLCNQVSNASMDAAKAEMDMIRKRYNATVSANNFMFMNTKLDKGVFGLVKLNKTSGAKESEIEFGKDKEPNYEIDDVASLLFYRSGPAEISCYKF